MSPTKRYLLCFLEGKEVPSSRFRVGQYIDKLNEPDLKVKALTTTPSKFLWSPRWAKGTPFYSLFIGVGLLAVITQRLVQILFYVPRATHIIIQRDLLYRISSPLLENLIFLLSRNGCRVIFDVDDAIHVGKDGTEKSTKVDSIAKRSALVITGNDYLNTHYKNHCKTVLIPTTVDLDRYNLAHRSDTEMIRIGWTGVASNLHYLENIKASLSTTYKEHPFTLTIMCEAGTPLPFSEQPFPVECIAWSPEKETKLAENFDIGLMPLTETPWSKGKCGFKLLQYMAAGLPAIASPVGVNKEIITDGRDGFLAKSAKEWEQALLKLITSPKLRAEVGSAARKTVEERYSLKRWVPKWKEAVFIGKLPE